MHKRTITLFLTALAFLMPALTLPAQSADGTISVVVTADRTETEETKTSAMVTIITAEDIADSGAADIPSLIEALPGVQFRSTVGPAQAQISMGGFGENSFGRVVVLVNGRRLNNSDMSGINWQSIPVDTIERIEVLHGGGSVLYGSGAIGGVVNIITKKAIDPLSVTVSSSWGSFNTFKEALSLELAGEKSELRIGGDWYSTDGHRDRTGQQSAHASIGGSLYPGDRLALGLGLSYAYNFYEMPGELTLSQFEDDPTQAKNPNDESTEHSISLDLSGEYSPSDTVRLELLTGYEYKNAAPDMVAWFSFEEKIYNTLTLNPKLEIETEVTNFPVSFISGIDSMYTDLKILTYDSIQRDNKSDENEVSFVAIGGYADVDLSLTSRAGITTGVRFDGARISDTTTEKWHSGPAWSASFRWNPNDYSKLYLRHERVFRYPFTDEQITWGTFLEGLEAEKGLLFEAGGMAEFGEMLRIDARTYLNLMQDEIVFTTTNENIDPTRRIGGELKAKYKPVDYILLNGSYSYVLPTFSEGDYEGNQVPLVSNHEAEGTITVSLPAGFEIEAGTSYQSEAYQGGDLPNTNTKMDPYIIFDAAVRLQQEIGKGDLSISCSISDISDVSYSPYIYWSGYYPAPGRSFTLSGSYTY